MTERSPSIEAQRVRGSLIGYKVPILTQEQRPFVSKLERILDQTDPRIAYRTQAHLIVSAVRDLGAGGDEADVRSRLDGRRFMQGPDGELSLVTWGDCTHYGQDLFRGLLP